MFLNNYSATSRLKFQSIKYAAGLLQVVKSDEHPKYV